MSSLEAAALRQSFLATYPYDLDRFQLEAMDVLDDGHSVLVTAPTGSGKTVVAEYAVHMALRRGVKAFYTTPLKALSNQKYRDLARRHGAQQVGLLTGDNSVNPEAPVVVMTTEVLRNMIHSERTSLATLGFVILDEVHFLENPYRGGVWEEVIIGAPEKVRLVCLSATVANADELAAWIRGVRGGTGVVREDRRPVVLHDLFAIGDRTNERMHLLPVFVDGRPNRQAVELDALISRHGSPRARTRLTTKDSGRARPRTYRPRRAELLERLRSDDLLPAIIFVFSRAGCDDAVRYCLDDGVRLTSSDERQKIRELVEARVDALSDADLGVLGYGGFLAALEAGLAPHHAGMVPPFREAVEECFSNSLVKAVFATETLALGINMPARSVVVEDLTKFNGSGHEQLTPGEYTQLTGRAGRRGVDEVGYAVVVASPYYSFDDVASLAGAPGRALTSSFRPTYNLAVSLVRRFERAEAYRIVTSSFAQFLSERDLGGQLTEVLSMLEARGYVKGWSLTATGEMLAGLYHEADLLIAESLRLGLLDGLEPASLAAVTSSFCFESRRDREGSVDTPHGAVAERLQALEVLSFEMAGEEQERGLPVMRGIDPGFAALARDWARGRELAQVLAGPKVKAQPKGAVRPRPAGRGPGGRPGRPLMTGGDFVRNVKQLIDLLGQLAVVAPAAETRASASAASRRLRRGVVAASSEVHVPAAGNAETIHAQSREAP